MNMGESSVAWGSRTPSGSLLPPPLADHHHQNRSVGLFLDLSNLWIKGSRWRSSKLSIIAEDLIKLASDFTTHDNIGMRHSVVMGGQLEEDEENSLEALRFDTDQVHDESEAFEVMSNAILIWLWDEALQKQKLLQNNQMDNNHKMMEQELAPCVTLITSNAKFGPLIAKLRRRGVFVLLVSELSGCGTREPVPYSLRKDASVLYDWNEVCLILERFGANQDRLESPSDDVDTHKNNVDAKGDGDGDKTKTIRLSAQALIDNSTRLQENEINQKEMLLKQKQKNRDVHDNSHSNSHSNSNQMNGQYSNSSFHLSLNSSSSNSSHPRKKSNNDYHNSRSNNLNDDSDKSDHKNQFRFSFETISNNEYNKSNHISHHSNNHNDMPGSLESNSPLSSSPHFEERVRVHKKDPSPGTSSETASVKSTLSSKSSTKTSSSTSEQQSGQQNSSSNMKTNQNQNHPNLYHNDHIYDNKNHNDIAAHLISLMRKDGSSFITDTTGGDRHATTQLAEHLKALEVAWASRSIPMVIKFVRMFTRAGFDLQPYFRRLMSNQRIVKNIADFEVVEYETNVVVQAELFEFVLKLVGAIYDKYRNLILSSKRNSPATVRRAAEKLDAANTVISALEGCEIGELTEELHVTTVDLAHCLLDHAPALQQADRLLRLVSVPDHLELVLLPYVDKWIRSSDVGASSQAYNFAYRYGLMDKLLEKHLNEAIPLAASLSNLGVVGGRKNNTTQQQQQQYTQQFHVSDDIEQHNYPSPTPSSRNGSEDNFSENVSRTTWPHDSMTNSSDSELMSFNDSEDSIPPPEGPPPPLEEDVPIQLEGDIPAPEGPPPPLEEDVPIQLEGDIPAPEGPPPPLEEDVPIQLEGDAASTRRTEHYVPSDPKLAPFDESSTTTLVSESVGTTVSTLQHRTTYNVESNTSNTSNTSNQSNTSNTSNRSSAHSANTGSSGGDTVETLLEKIDKLDLADEEHMKAEQKKREIELMNKSIIHGSQLSRSPWAATSPSSSSSGNGTINTGTHSAHSSNAFGGLNVSSSTSTSTSSSTQSMNAFLSGFNHFNSTTTTNNARMVENVFKSNMKNTPISMNSIAEGSRGDSRDTSNGDSIKSNCGRDDSRNASNGDSIKSVATSTSPPSFFGSFDEYLNEPNTLRRIPSAESLSGLLLRAIEPDVGGNPSFSEQHVENRVLALLNKHRDGLLGSDIPRFYWDEFGERLVLPENVITHERVKLKDFLLGIKGVGTYTKNTQPVFVAIALWEDENMPSASNPDSIASTIANMEASVQEPPQPPSLTPLSGLLNRTSMNAYSAPMLESTSSALLLPSYSSSPSIYRPNNNHNIHQQQQQNQQTIIPVIQHSPTNGNLHHNMNQSTQHQIQHGQTMLQQQIDQEQKQLQHLQQQQMKTQQQFQHSSSSGSSSMSTSSSSMQQQPHFQLQSIQPSQPSLIEYQRDGSSSSSVSTPPVSISRSQSFNAAGSKPSVIGSPPINPSSSLSSSSSSSSSSSLSSSVASTISSSLSASSAEFKSASSSMSPMPSLLRQPAIQQQQQTPFPPPSQQQSSSSLSSSRNNLLPFHQSLDDSSLLNRGNRSLGFTTSNKYQNQNQTFNNHQLRNDVFSGSQNSHPSNHNNTPSSSSPYNNTPSLRSFSSSGDRGRSTSNPILPNPSTFDNYYQLTPTNTSAASNMKGSFGSQSFMNQSMKNSFNMNVGNNNMNNNNNMNGNSDSNMPSFQYMGSGVRGPSVDQGLVRLRLVALLKENDGILGAQLPSKYLETYSSALHLEAHDGTKIKLKEYLLSDEMMMLLANYQGERLRLVLVKAGHDRKYSIVPDP